MTLYGGIEGGGTKFACAVGSNTDQPIFDAAVAQAQTWTLDEAVAYALEDASG